MDLSKYSLLIWILVGLLALELGLEARAVGRGFDPPLLGPFFPEQAGGAPKPGFGPVTEFPFRGPILGREKAPGALRVWLSSSSYAEDVMVAAEDLFPTLLGQFASTDVRPVQVINASRAGDGLGANIEDWNEHAADWQPDVALLYQLSNEIDWRGTLAALRARGESAPEETGEAGPAERAAGADRLTRFVESTVVYRHIQTRMTTRIALQKLDSVELERVDDEAFVGRVRAWIAAVRRSGVQPVVCTFAVAYGPADVDEVPAALVQQVRGKNLELSIETWLTSIPRWNRLLVETAAAEGVPLIDVDRRLSGRSELFRDLWHFTEDGHAELARCLAEALDDL